MSYDIEQVHAALIDGQNPLSILNRKEHIARILKSHEIMRKKLQEFANQQTITEICADPENEHGELGDIEYAYDTFIEQSRQILEKVTKKLSR